MLMNINCISVSAADRLNIIFVICKVVTILTVIVAGLVRIGQGLLSFVRNRKYDSSFILGHTQNLQNGFVGRREE
jgi:L-asparagine transporter-like permease